MTGACAGALKNFFRFLIDKKGFPQEIEHIHFDKSKSVKKFPKSIDPIEVQKLIDSMPSVLDRNLTIVVYTLGLRISEALKLKWSNFHWVTWLQDKNKDSAVDLVNTKGGKFRTIPAPRELMEKLYNDHERRTNDGVPIGTNIYNLIFDFGMSNYQEPGKSIDEIQYNYIVTHAEDRYRKLLYRISKEVLGKRINPHQLRHAKALDMMNHGVPIESIKAFLGHARISSTEVYAAASPEKLRKDLEEYNRVISKN